MASGNVGIVQSIYDAFSRRDIAGFFAKLAEDVELVQSEEVPWGGTYKGKDGVKSFLSKLTGAVESSFTFERFIDAGRHIVAIGRTEGKTKPGGVPFSVQVAHIWEICDGSVVRMQFCIDNPTMLKALKSESPS